MLRHMPAIASDPTPTAYISDKGLYDWGLGFELIILSTRTDSDFPSFVMTVTTSTYVRR